MTAKFEGYIEKRYVNTTGQYVRGEALIEGYSRALVTAQQEYLTARPVRRHKRNGLPS